MISLELLNKYNGPLPRYTSYPSVADWAEVPTEAEWIQSLAEAMNAGPSDQGLALYIHIPFCEMLCTYCGCSTRITRNHGVAETYIASVHKEWTLYRKRLQRRMVVDTLYLGGGTPTFFSPAELHHLMEKVEASVEVPSRRSYTVEVDPRVTQKSHLEVLFRHGFNEVSLGVQDFDPIVQEVVNRVHSEERVKEVTDFARNIGYSKMNYDLIYGLPRQTLKGLESTIKAVGRLRPDRVSFYGYFHVPWIRHGQRQFTEDDLPTVQEKCRLYELGYQLLHDLGYREIGMNYFVLANDLLWQAVEEGTLHRNFMGYFPWASQALIGLGVSAMGDAWTAFAQNEKSVEVYQERVGAGELPLMRGHLLTDEDRILRRHIFNLITHMETQWDAHQPAVLGVMPGMLCELEQLEQDGLIQLASGSCQVTELGRSFLKNICAVFDARRQKREWS